MFLSSAFAATTSEMFAGGVERLSTLMLQIGFSVMVIKTVREKNYLWLLLAFVIHTVIDFGAVMLFGNLNVWALESGIFVVAFLMVWFVYNEYKKSAFTLPNNRGN